MVECLRCTKCLTVILFIVSLYSTYYPWIGSEHSELFRYKLYRQYGLGLCETAFNRNPKVRMISALECTAYLQYD